MLLRYGTDGDELVVLCCDAHSLNAISVGCFVFCLSRGSFWRWLLVNGRVGWVLVRVLTFSLVRGWAGNFFDLECVERAAREAKFILKSCEELKRMIG